jgi:hypothetical protein
MNDRKPSPLVPALIAGAAGGILSGVPFVNCLCCLWIIGAGSLAVYLSAKQSPTLPGAAEGAQVGALSGVFAAAAVSLLSLPLASLNAAFFRRFLERMAEYVDKMPEGWQQWFTRGEGPFSMFWFVMGFVINAAVFAALAALGGIIGATLFGRRTAVPPAPPSPGSPS